jgi:lysophospholipase L1-like esterase
MKILALGDSYTIGESVDESERWPVQLAKMLSREGIQVGSPEIIATTGWTTSELDAGIQKAAPKGNRDLVTLLIGVNNQYRAESLKAYRSEFELLLRQAIRLADHNPQRVVVVSIPDYGITPFIAGKPDREPAKIAKELDQFNAAAAEIVRRHNVHWVDITPVSRKVGASKEMLAEDGLHPSGKMYALWAEAVLPVARRILK